MSLNQIATNRCAQREAALLSQGQERGAEAANVRNMHDFMVQGLQHLEEGDYSGWLTCMDLAGQFARDARTDFLKRTVK